MAKPRRSGISCSAVKTKEAPKQQLAKSSADKIANEHTAATLFGEGRLQEAEAIYKELIGTDANQFVVFTNIALICKVLGRLDEHILYLRQSIEFNPRSPEAYNDLGVALKRIGDPSAASSMYIKAIGLRPEYAEARNNLGNLFFEQEDFESAFGCYTTAIELKPCYPSPYNGLANALKAQGNLSAAIASYNKALELKPNYPEAQINLGNALLEQGDPSAAIASYSKVLELKPNYPDAHWNSSNALLLSGDYKNGWVEYEWRALKETDTICPSANPTAELWHGDPPLSKSSKLLLVSEQGLGDTLQFMRYAIALRNQGFVVSICAPPKLHSLVKASGIDPFPLTPEQANQVSEGQWIPLLSVPRHLEVSPDNPIITESYIETTQDLLAKWDGILSAEQRPIIGINWQGNPGQEKRNAIGRSLPLETFAPIATQSNVCLLSLQKGFGSEQLESCSFKDRFVSCQDQVNATWDFLETAAIIANCDLVITSDTSVAHLAGGMGKTTWLLLKKVPEWRWGLDGDTSFWYPSMRLFRQSERGNWSEVLERVAQELQRFFGANPEATQAAPAAAAPTKPEPIQDIQAPISLGELIDKITILQIKSQHLEGAALENVKQELEALEATRNNLQVNIDSTLIQRLKEVNQLLWTIEDDIREQERQKAFGETFIYLARSVYQQNDRRAMIKKEINITYGSALVEEKSYQGY